MLREMPRLGVSSCLLGDNVRYDGGHTRDGFVANDLDRFVEWVRVCPEVELGMGVPRPTLRLIEKDGRNRLVVPSTGEDFTERMDRFADVRIGGLKDAGLDGYILKKRSPSCGLERIAVYRGDQRIGRDGVGAFAARLTELWPDLPVEEEGRLNDPAIREHFLERVFARYRWRVASQRGWTRRRLVAFHTEHKMLLRAHDERGYRRLGALVGSAGSIDDAELFAAYEREFHACLRHRASTKRHVNVLEHALGYLKRVLDAGEKREILGAIEGFRNGLLPRMVPIALLRFNMSKHGVGYLDDQIYLRPRFLELLHRPR